MIKIPKEMIVDKIKEKTGMSDKEIKSRVKDKLDKLSGLISEEGALHIIANELGVKILEETGKLQIKNVLAGMRNVEITGKVIRKYEVRQFNKEGKAGKVGSFLVGDETGVIRVVAWNDKADLLDTLQEGMVVKIDNGYSREDNQGRSEVHLGDRSKITVEDKNIDVKTRESADRKSIKDLNENDSNVEIMGTIVQAFDPRFFAVDPQTGKRAIEKNGEFFAEDKKIPNIEYSFVTNVVLDDGTESVRVVLWKNQTEKLFGLESDKIVAMREEGFENIKNDLLGKIVKLVGRTNKNDMFNRTEFIANLVFNNPDPKEELERISKDLKKDIKKQEMDLTEKGKPETLVEEVKDQNEEKVDLAHKSKAIKHKETTEEVVFEIEEGSDDSNKDDELEAIEDIEDLDSI